MELSGPTNNEFTHYLAKQTVSPTHHKHGGKLLIWLGFSPDEPCLDTQFYASVFIYWCVAEAVSSTNFVSGTAFSSGLKVIEIDSPRFCFPELPQDSSRRFV